MDLKYPSKGYIVPKSYTLHFPRKKNCRFFSSFLLCFPPQCGLVDSPAFPHLKTFFPWEKLCKIRVSLLAQLGIQLTSVSGKPPPWSASKPLNHPLTLSRKASLSRSTIKSRAMHSQGLKNSCQVHFCRHFVIWSLIDWPPSNPPDSSAPEWTQFLSPHWVKCGSSPFTAAPEPQ